MKLLTILIPTIPQRWLQFQKLNSALSHQVADLQLHFPSTVVVRHLMSDSFVDGGLSVGAKRQELIMGCDSKYLCFLDDDELPSPNYVEQLVRLCLIGTDIVTFRSLYKCDTYWGIADMSIHHPSNEQATPYGVFKRKPFHICPVKTEIAQQCEFPDINNAEDWAYMEQVLKHCTTEIHTDQILHQYNHSKFTSAVDAITNT